MLLQKLGPVQLNNLARSHLQDFSLAKSRSRLQVQLNAYSGKQTEFNTFNHTTC